MITIAFFGATVICATSSVSLADALYESVSAIGTVGLSSAGTAGLSVPAKLLLIPQMYFGRVGVLTISVGFLRKKPAGEKYRYAAMDLLIG